MNGRSCSSSAVSGRGMESDSVFQSDHKDAANAQ